jgi:hypothetical protein
MALSMGNAASVTSINGISSIIEYSTESHAQRFEKDDCSTHRYHFTTSTTLVGRDS